MAKTITDEEDDKMLNGLLDNWLAEIFSTDPTELVKEIETIAGCPHCGEDIEVKPLVCGFNGRYRTLTFAWKCTRPYCINNDCWIYSGIQPKQRADALRQLSTCL